MNSLLQDALDNAHDAERALVGGMIDNEDIRSMAFAELETADFSGEAQTLIFNAIQTLWRRGDGPVTSLEITAYLRERGELDQAGGPSAISFGDLNDHAIPPAVPGLIAAIKKGKRTRDESKLTRMRDAGDLTLEEYTHALSRLSEQRGTKSPEGSEVSKRLGAWANNIYSGNGPGSIPTGIRCIDDHFGGLFESELTIAAARPGMGKTSLAATMFINNLRANVKPSFVSLEMEDIRIAGRMACQIAGVSFHDFRRGRCKKDEITRFMEAKEWLARQSHRIHEPKYRTIESIMPLIREDVRRGVDVVYIDYLGLMTSSSQRAKFSRQAEVQTITGELKQLALTQKIPIFLLAQLNREVEKNQGKGKVPRPPRLSDLRESGSIEQDADNVLFIHRPEQPEDATIMDVDLNVAKARDAAHGLLPLTFDAEQMTFRDRDPVPISATFTI